MGFFYVGGEVDAATSLPVHLLRQHECALCPLNHAANLLHPKMEPYGPARAMFYGLGEAPGKQEDEQGRPFVGPSGQLLHSHLPDGIQVRWNNTIRCRPLSKDGDNRPPEPSEIEACRPSIERDI